jgi:hypothetical protein
MTKSYHYTGRASYRQRGGLPSQPQSYSFGVRPLFYGGKAWGDFGGQTPIYEMAPI